MISINDPTDIWTFGLLSNLHKLGLILVRINKTIHKPLDFGKLFKLCFSTDIDTFYRCFIFLHVDVEMKNK